MGTSDQCCGRSIVARRAARLTGRRPGGKRAV